MRFLLLFLIISGCSTKKENSCGFFMNDGQRVSLKDTAPATFYIHESVPPELYEPISLSAGEWNSAAGRQIINISKHIVRGGGWKKDGKNIIYFVKEWKEQERSRRATAKIWWNGDLIKEVDIVFNIKHFSFDYDGVIFGLGAINTIDFKTVMTHEFGHAIGLNHYNDKTSIMYPYLESGETKALSNIEKKNILCEY